MLFKTEKQAQTKCDEVLAALGNTWKGRVWENLGWHCSWQWGSVTLYYSTYANDYSVLIGTPWGCGGHMDLSHSDEESYKDPKEAIRLACDSALEVIEKEWKPIQLSVTQVRASLKVINTYKWRIHSLSGEVDAVDLQEALKKVIDLYYEAVPFPADKFTDLNIVCKKIKN